MADQDEPVLLAVHDAVLLDLDGTVYHGARVIPGAVDAIAAVREQGTAVRFVTNNASKRPEDVAEHLRALGVPAEPSEVGTSAQAAAVVLRERLPGGATVLVVGAGALEAQVESAGMRPVRTFGDEPVDAVVQGHSTHTAWADLAEACLAIRAGADWIACNLDVTLPAERGQLPGNGAMVAALRAATGREPVVAGKPRSPLFRVAADSARASNPLVVGDRLDTDIEGAVEAGLASLVVLTGVVTPADLLAAPPEQRPTHVGADMWALTQKASELEVAPKPGWRIEPAGTELRVTSDGARDSLDLLRALCDASWRHGPATVRAGDDHAAAALAELGL